MFNACKLGLGQSAALARAESASVVTERAWNEAEALLRG
jgi:hypothetical protein